MNRRYDRSNVDVDIDEDLDADLDADLDEDTDDIDDIDIDIIGHYYAVAVNCRRYTCLHPSLLRYGSTSETSCWTTMDLSTTPRRVAEGDLQKTRVAKSVFSIRSLVDVEEVELPAAEDSEKAQIVFTIHPAGRSSIAFIRVCDSPQSSTSYPRPYPRVVNTPDPARLIEASGAWCRVRGASFGIPRRRVVIDGRRIFLATRPRSPGEKGSGWTEIENRRGDDGGDDGGDEGSRNREPFDIPRPREMLVEADFLPLTAFCARCFAGNNQSLYSNRVN
ncbi:hypothetical protein WN48_00443 [Eufriesea mexicana]|nr:hypothetical protein WN48_00443 [Eufriesea mexicana]